LYDDLITVLTTFRAPSVAALAPLPLRQPADRLSDRLAQRLAGLIEAGTLAPGERLPTEQQLATAHGVSRTVVREAVHQLKSRALVSARQGSGVYVLAAPSNQPLAFDPSVLESVEAVVHVVEVRRVLEGEIAALAAQHATRAQVAAMRRALKSIDAAVAAGRDGVAEDLAFHRAIGDASGNPQFGLLLGFLEQYLREGMRITRGNEARRQDFMQEVQNEHRVMVAAIARRDAEAARAAALHHISRGRQRLVEGGVLTPAQSQATPSGRKRAGAQTAAQQPFKEQTQ